MDQKKKITRLLMNVQQGDDHAYNVLFSIVYDRLKEIANYQLMKSALNNNETLSKTALVHEVYLKLADYQEINWKDRAHFYAVASRCMRQLLVDYARKKTAEKRGGKKQNLTLKEDQLNIYQHAEKLIEVNNLIDTLSQFDERKSKVVEMRFFSGMTAKEISEVLNVSTRTVDRDWLKARTWILKELKQADSGM